MVISIKGTNSILIKGNIENMKFVTSYPGCRILNQALRGNLKPIKGLGIGPFHVLVTKITLKNLFPV